MKRRLLALILALSCAFSLVACGSQTPPVSEEPDKDPVSETKEPITLKLWAGVAGEYGYDQLVEDFNEEFADEGISLEFTRYVNDDDGNLQLETYLMGGDDIDVYIAYGGTDSLFSRIDAGIALDMTDYLEARDFDPIAELGENNVASFVYNNKYYALPTKYENKLWMVVNADMFAEAGIDLPLNGWTYSEFADTAKKLTSGEGLDKVYGMFWNLNASWKNSTLFVGSELGKYQTYADDTLKVSNMDHDLWQKGLDLLVTSADEGWAYSLEQEVADSVDFNNSFLAGKAAMAAGIYNLRTIKDLETYPHDFETALVPYPVPDESYLDQWSHADYPGAGDLIMVNPKSAHLEEAMDFVVWYITGGMAPLASGGRIPLWSGFDADSIVSALCVNEGVFNVDSIKAYMSIDTREAYAAPATDVDSKIATVKKEEMQAALYGKISVEEACTNMKTRADDLLR